MPVDLYLGDAMKRAVIRTWLLCFFTILLVGLLNIDAVLSWYGNRIQERDEVMEALSAVKRIQMEAGIGPWLNEAECAAGIVFEGSYKDKSKCREGWGAPAAASDKAPALSGFDREGNRSHDTRAAASFEGGMGRPVQPEAMSMTPEHVEDRVRKTLEGMAFAHAAPHGRKAGRHTALWERAEPAGSGLARAATEPERAIQDAKPTEPPGTSEIHKGRENEADGESHQAMNRFETAPPDGRSASKVATGSEESSDQGAASGERLEEDDRDSGRAAAPEGVAAAGPPDAADGREKPKEPAVTGDKLALVRPLEDLQSQGSTTPHPHENLWGRVQGRQFQSMLLVGDSLAHGLAMSLENDVKSKDGAEFSYFAKVSSGLNNPNVLNWEKTIRMLLDRETPDLVMIMMGVNDANNHIRDGGKLCVVGTPEWENAYEKKVESFLRIVSDKHIRVCWIGAPVVREDWLQKRVGFANSAARTACGKLENCLFIDTSDALCDERGRYTNYLREDNGSNVRIRAKDGIHFSMAGSGRLSKYVLLKLEGAEKESSHVGN